ncbi:MAG: hypothetical protein ACFE0J_11445 [Elainellaceae cyanobacterium]
MLQSLFAETFELAGFDDQAENFANLQQTIQDSIDDPLTEEDIQGAIASFEDIISDQTITSDEWQQIATGITSTVQDLGISAFEVHDILLAAQEIVADSQLPQLSEEILGSSGNDILIGKGGNDVLIGTDSTGQGEIDILIGGAGQDKFVLGMESATFYDDEQAFTTGISDFALIADFNVNTDIIQLTGSATDYSLGSIPDSLQEMAISLDGTAIYKRSSGNSTAELVGIIYGYEVNNFNTGFEFV